MSRFHRCQKHGGKQGRIFPYVRQANPQEDAVPPGAHTTNRVMVCSWLSLKCRMIFQQPQCSFGIASLKGIDTYGANRKPDGAGHESIFLSSLDHMDPVRSDRLALN